MPRTMMPMVRRASKKSVKRVTINTLTRMTFPKKFLINRPKGSSDNSFPR